MSKNIRLTANENEIGKGLQERFDSVVKAIARVTNLKAALREFAESNAGKVKESHYNKLWGTYLEPVTTKLVERKELTAGTVKAYKSYLRKWLGIKPANSGGASEKTPAEKVFAYISKNYPQLLAKRDDWETFESELDTLANEALDAIESDQEAEALASKIVGESE